MAKSRARKLADIIVSAGVDIDGNLTFDGGSTSADLTFADNDKANFGDASDLQIYHDGSASYIKEAGTGDFIIQGSNTLRLQGSSSQELANFGTGGAVTLFYNNSAKFATTSTGIDVTGTAVTDGVISDGVATIRVSGAGSTVEAFNVYNTNGTSNNSQVRLYLGANQYDTSGRGLRIDAGRDSGADGIATFYSVDQAEHSDYEAIKILTDGGVTLSHLGSNKIATTSTGIDVTGTVTADGLNLDGNIQGDTGQNMQVSAGAGVGDKLDLRAGDDVRIYVNGATAHKLSANFANNGDISFYEDTGTTAKLFWDASTERLGIGTTAPSNALEVAESGGGNSVARFNNLSESVSLVQFQDTGTTTRPRVGSAGNDLILDTANTERLRIAANGDILGRTADVRIGSNIGAVEYGTSTANSVRFYSNDTERMRITSAGNVGIGTSSPSEKLTVAGPIGVSATGYTANATTANFGLYTSGSVDTTYIQMPASGQFQVWKPSTGAVVTVLESGNMGIGTATPGGTLEVKGGNGNNFRLNNDGSTYTEMIFQNNGTSKANLQLVNNDFNITASQTGSKLRFYTENTQKMTLLANGNLGIGTSSPSSPLEVAGGSSYPTTKFSRDGGTAATQGYLTTGFSAIGYSGGTGADSYLVSEHGFGFAVNAGTNALVITDLGNVGIGTSSPSRPLDVTKAVGSIIANFKNSGGTSSFITLGNTSSTADQIRVGANGTALTLSTNYAERMRIDSSGNVGIGTTGYGTYYSGDRVLSLGSGTTIRGAASGVPYLTAVSNGYFDGTNWKYAQTHPATNYEQYNGNHTFSYAASGTAGNNITFSEAMRIDSSGNLLIGTTTYNSANQGILLGATGVMYSTNVSNISASFGRNTTDGAIVNLRKDNSTVGSIGNFYGYMYLGTEDTGLIFDDDNNHIKAWNPSTNGGRDAAVDLGASGTRFKDVYMSGVLEMRHSASGQINMTRIDSTIGVNNSLGQIVFGGSEDNGTTINNSASIVALSSQSHTSTRSGGHLKFSTTANHTTTLTEAMRITSAGNVGIGTTDPTEKLDVRGKLIFGGTGSSFYGNAGVFNTDSNGDKIIFYDDSGSSYDGRMGVGSSSNLWIKSHGESANEGIIELKAGGSIQLETGTTPTERMRIDSTGKTKIMTSTSSVAAAHSAADELQIVGDGVVSGITISNVSDSGTGTLFFGDTSSATAAGIRYNHNTGDMAISAEDFITMETDAVGIGNTSPNSKLHIQDNTSVVYDATAYQHNIFLEKRNTAGANQTTGLRFAVTGYDGSTTAEASIGILQTSNAHSGNLVFGTRHNGTRAERMRISSEGNVGIGTTSPVTKTHIAHSTVINDHYGLLYVQNTASATGSSSNAGVNVNNYTGTSQFMQWENYGLRIGSRRLFNGGAGDVIFTAGADSEKMRIKSGGNVGIGTTNPQHLLDTAGTIRHTSNIVSNTVYKAFSIGSDRSINDYGGLYKDYWAIQLATPGANTDGQSSAHAYGALKFSGVSASDTTLDDVLVLNYNGNVGIGRTSPNAKLDVNAGTTKGIEIALGTSSVPFINFLYGATTVGSITTTGSATVYNTSSDQRLKENIVDAPSASDDIDAIQVRSFDWKADGSHQKYGMVAQELQSVAPEAVTAPEDPEEMMGVDYSKLVPMLVKEIQSLRARVAELEGE